MTRNSLTCNELILLTFNNHNLHIKACRWKEFNVFYKLVLKILIYWISLSSLRFFVSKKHQTVLISAFRAAPATCFSLTFFSRCLDSSISMMALNPLCNSRSSVTFSLWFWVSRLDRCSSKKWPDPFDHYSELEPWIGY